MTDQWYPQGQGYWSPAFQTQRQLISEVAGGDYVRGSTVSTLPQTALRYRSVTVESIEEIQNRALVHARPFDYETAEILWGWSQSGTVSPQISYKWDTDTTTAAPAAGYMKTNPAASEATILFVSDTDATEAAYGEWANVKKGGNIYIYTARSTVEGDFTQRVYYEVVGEPSTHTVPTPHTQIPVSMVSISGFAPADDSSVVAVLPVTGNWMEVALIRSGFGYPVTVGDGETVFRAGRVQFEEVTPAAGASKLVPAPIVYDKPLTSGHWYYYSLFYRVSPVDWVRGGSDAVLIPRYHRHNQHLWNAVPPFYQMTDSNVREGNGPLRQWFDIFGFELDTIREFVESWQNLYHIDLTPSALLRHLGGNFGVPYEAGVGDIRYRALLAALPQLLLKRGTADSLKRVVEAMSKYECEITTGTNMLVLPDDADFFSGVGNWAAWNPATTGMGAEITAINPTPMNAVTLIQSASPPKPQVPGRRSMRVYTSDATKTQNLFLTLGNGIFNQTKNPVTWADTWPGSIAKIGVKGTSGTW